MSGNVRYFYDSRNKRIWQGNFSTDFNGNVYLASEQIFFYGVDGKKLGTYPPLITYGGVRGNIPQSIVFTQAYPFTTNAYFGGKLIQQGTTTFMPDRLNSNGKYFPYGEERNYPALAPDQVKFATYTRDGATGLDYADQRYYASSFGRFTTPDPYMASGGPADSQSWNRYAYVRSDPVNRFDPAGLADFSVNGYCYSCLDGYIYIAGGGDKPPQRPKSDDTDRPVPGSSGVSIQARLQARLLGALFNLPVACSNAFQNIGISTSTLIGDSLLLAFFDTTDPTQAAITVGSINGTSDPTTLAAVVSGPTVAAFIPGTNAVVLSGAYFLAPAQYRNDVLIHEDLHYASGLGDAKLAYVLGLFTLAQLPYVTVEAASVALTSFIDNGCKPVNPVNWRRSMHLSLPMIGISILTSCILLSAEKTIRFVDKGGVVDKAVLVPQSQFSKPVVESLARDFARATVSRVIIARLTIGTDASEIEDSLGRDYVDPPGPCILGNYHWPAHPIARVFVTGNGVRIAYKEDPHGIAEQWQLSGSSDLTEVHFGETVYTLLHFSLTKDVYDIHLFYEASQQPSAKESLQLLEKWQALFGRKLLWLGVRTDSWFPEWSQFPIVYPFDTKYPRPSLHDVLPMHLREYYRAPEIDCGTLADGKDACPGVYNSRP